MKQFGEVSDTIWTLYYAHAHLGQRVPIVTASHQMFETLEEAERFIMDYAIWGNADEYTFNVIEYVLPPF